MDFVYWNIHQLFCLKIYKDDNCNFMDCFSPNRINFQIETVPIISNIKREMQCLSIQANDKCQFIFQFRNTLTKTVSITFNSKMSNPLNLFAKTLSYHALTCMQPIQQWCCIRFTWALARWTMYPINDDSEEGPPKNMKVSHFPD